MQYNSLEQGIGVLVSNTNKVNKEDILFKQKKIEEILSLAKCGDAIVLSTIFYSFFINIWSLLWKFSA